MWGVLLKVSCVMPVHNESEYLPYSLGSLLGAGIDEFIPVLDRCDDGSERIVDDFSETAEFTVKKVKLSRRKWSYPTAEVVQKCFLNASGDIVYAVGADMLVDRGIFSIDWTGIDVAIFNCKDYSLHGNIVDKIQSNWTNTSRKVSGKAYYALRKKPPLTGLYAFRRYVFDRIGLRDVPSEDVWFLKHAIKQFRYKRFPRFQTLHLRPTTINDRKRQCMHGFSRAKQLHYSFWKVLAHSIVLGKPYTLQAYLQTRITRLNP